MPHKHTPDDLTALIKQQYRSKVAFAEAVGLPAHTLYSILSGESFTTCSLSSAMAITQALGLDPRAFAEGRLEPETQTAATTTVPIFDEFTPGEKPQQKGSFPIPAKLARAHPNAFILRIKDNAMNRILAPGFLALVAPNTKSKTANTLYAISIDASPAIIRRLVFHDNGFTLAPESKDPTYRPQLIDYANGEAPDVKLIGEVIWYCPPVK